MKRFLTTGFAALVLVSVFPAVAQADTFADQAERSPQTAEAMKQQNTEKQAVNVASKTQPTNDNTLSERDRIILQYQLQQVIPRQK